MSQENKTTISIEVALNILDGFLIPDNENKKSINAKFNRLVVDKKDQTLIVIHDEDRGLYHLTYIPIKKSLFGNDYKEYYVEIGYAYFSVESLNRLRRAFGDINDDNKVNLHLELLKAKPNKTYNFFKYLLTISLFLLVIAGIGLGIYYMVHDDEFEARRASMKLYQDQGCDGHTGVKEYVYYPNINNIYTCNDGTRKVYQTTVKGLEQ